MSSNKINSNRDLKIPIVAEYGNILARPEDVAIQRGLGLYNPPPNFEQSTNRGPSYNNALNVYVNGSYFKNDQKDKLSQYDKNEKAWASVESYLDNQNQKKYEVGSTDMYGSVNDSWSRSVESKSTQDQYQLWAMSATNMTPSPLLNYFFSEKNVDYIQNMLIQEVKRIKNVDIAKQSIDELLIIMKNRYEYALSGWLPKDSKDPTKIFPRTSSNNNPNDLAYDKNANGGHNLKYQIITLNKSVIEECVKQILSGIIAYEKYYLDASSMPLPLSQPVYISSKGSNSLQENIGFQSGHETTKAMSSYNQRFNII